MRRLTALEHITLDGVIQAAVQTGTYAQ